MVNVLGALVSVICRLHFASLSAMMHRLCECANTLVFSWGCQPAIGAKWEPDLVGMTSGSLLVTLLCSFVFFLGGSGLAVLVAKMELLLSFSDVLGDLLPNSCLGMTCSGLALLGCNKIHGLQPISVGSI